MNKWMTVPGHFGDLCTFICKKWGFLIIHSVFEISINKKFFKWESFGKYNSGGKKYLYYKRNPLADKNVKYDKRFKLLIRGEKAPKESIFDSKKNLIHALKFAYINLFLIWF